jgi:hypothetical protein
MATGWRVSEPSPERRVFGMKLLEKSSLELEQSGASND